MKNKKYNQLMIFILIIFIMASVIDIDYASAQDNDESSSVITRIDDCEWSRSSENNVINFEKSYEWDWDDVNKITTPVDDQLVVWDGQNERNYSGFSWLDLFVPSPSFDFASWELKTSRNKKEVRRFRTILTVPEGFNGSDLIRMKSINQDAYESINNGNIVPINDNIYVFVYKLKPNTNPNDYIPAEEINNDNFTDYLAFWSGTVCDDRTYDQEGFPKFHEKEGTLAHQYKYSIINWYGENYEYSTLVHTGGWCCYANVDNIGKYMPGAKANDKYVIDIFVEDYSGGGGMDKFIFEMVKTYVPTTQSDTYVFGMNHQSTAQTSYSVDFTNGLLSNDISNTTPAGELTAELYVDKDNEGKVIKINNSNRYKLFDSIGNEVGIISKFESDGTFKFTPTNDYVGQGEFNYICHDNKQQKTEKVIINVLPSVNVNCYEIKYDETNDIVTSKNKKLDTKTIYGVPKDCNWNYNWVFPKQEYISNDVLVAPQKIDTNYSEYMVTRPLFSGYEYIGRYNPADGYLKETISARGILSKNSNNDIEFYYVKSNENITVLIVEDLGNNQISIKKSDQFKQKVDTPYTIDPTYYTTGDWSIEGYQYANKYQIDNGDIINATGSIKGTMPKGKSIEIKLYIEKKEYNYYVKYFFNNTEDSTYVNANAPFKAKYNTLIGSNEDYSKVVKLPDKILEGWELDKTENYPLTISSDETMNVIKVYYKKEVNVYTGMYIDNEFRPIFNFVQGCCYPGAILIKGNGTYKITVASTDANIRVVSDKINTGNKVLLQSEEGYNVIPYYFIANPNANTVNNKFRITVRVEGDVNAEFTTDSLTFVEMPKVE